MVNLHYQLSWQTKLSCQRRSATVSLETYPLCSFIALQFSMLSTHSLSFSNCLILFLLVNSSSGFNPSAKISCLSCSSSSSFSCLNLASRACKALRFSYKSYIIPIYSLLAQTIWFINRVECFWLITNKESHLFTRLQKDQFWDIISSLWQVLTQISKDKSTTSY